MKLEQGPWLAIEHDADRLKGREANRLCLAGFEDRQVGDGDVDACGEFRQRHAPLVQFLVEAN